LSSHHVLPFAAKIADLETVGGKGLSLASMSHAGFDVPPGFTIATSAYREFVAASDLQQQIIDLARPELVGRTVSFEAASESIQALFAGVELNNSLNTQIADAYGELGEPPVAVRSSANAEDLPDLSFAGQQDTYLNVRGIDAVTAAVLNCWASLWTARAIGYRHENDIAQDAVAMAVVIQSMVPSKVSGILFTANPATGERSEMIVNASFGLGEAVVGGEVTPDSFIIEKGTLAVKETMIGSKEHMIVSADRQGTDTRELTATEREQASLSEPLLQTLAALAVKVEGHFQGVPQDIEWAFVDEKLFLLQSRPITNLPPQPLKDIAWEKPELPEYADEGPMLRKNLVEHIPGPVSPLFEDIYVYDAISLGSVHAAVNGYAYWIFGKPPGFKPLPGVVKVQPGSRARGAMKDALADPTLKGVVVDLGTDAFARMYAHRLKLWRDEVIPAYLAVVDKWRQVDLATASDDTLVDGIVALARADGETWFSRELGGTVMLMNAMRGAEGTFQLFLDEAAPGKGFTSGQFLSGLRSISMEAQDEVGDIAEMIKTDDALVALVATTPPQRLLLVLREEDSAALIVQTIDQHLARYGHQINTLDFVEPTLVEDPTPLMLNLKAVVLDPDHDPAAKQMELARRKQTALREAKETFSGADWKELCEFLWIMKRIYPDRDNALFYLALGWPTLRRFALELGRRLVEVGTLQAPDDLFYLRRAQLQDAIAAHQDGKAMPALQTSVTEQRELRAARMRLVPPDAVPPEEGEGPGWGKVANDADSNVLNGNACSPGQVTARASLIMSPADFGRMEPGTILVCPMTTPAWTQLFSQAKGLVTDIGGILTHGSIVAREYNIPAVLGLGIATQKISHGQMVTVDGDAGTVSPLED
jgi:rifampicin phosphotransferase